LDNKVFDIINARCNHEVKLLTFFINPTNKLRKSAVFN